MFKKIIVIGLLILCTVLIADPVTKSGTTAVGFLNIDVGSRAVGMGSAYCTLAEDATAMYWNPAGIARIPGYEALFSYTRWIADITFNYAGMVIPLGNTGTIGINATFLTMDDMERTTIDQPDGTGETFSAGDLAVGVSYARNLTDRFSIGFTAKYIEEKIYHSKASAFAIDVGTMFDTQFQGLKIGMSISNYGTKMQMTGRDMLTQKDPDPQISGNNDKINASLNTDQFDLPLMFRVGVSMDFLKGISNSNLILSVDALHPNDNAESVNIGLEYTFNNMFSLRGGYKSLLLNDSEEGLSAGGGLKYPIAGTEIRLDYAYHSFGILNDVQMLSIGLSF
jgi:hypothetical protein